MARHTGDHRPSSGFAPTARFRPPPPRQGAPLRLGPHRGPAAPRLPWGPPHPHCPLARRAPTDSAPQFPQNIPPCGREAGPSHLGAASGTTALPWGAAPGPAPHRRRRPSPGLRTCALGRSPYPNPRSRAWRRLLPLFILGHLAEPAPKASSGFHLFRQEGGDSGWSQSGRWCRVRLEAGEAEALGRMGERWVRGGEGCQPLGCPEGGKLGPGCLDQRRRFGSVIRSVFPLGKIKQRRDSGCVF